MEIRHKCKGLSGFTVCQGSCTDGEYIYIAFERKSPHAIKIVKIKGSKCIKVSKPLQIGHANGMCCKDGMLYVTHSDGSHNIHVVAADKLTAVKSIKVKYKKSNIAKYKNSYFNGIATWGSGYVLRVMGGQHMLVVNKNFEAIRAFKCESQYGTSQGICVHGGKLYRCFSDYQSTNNYIAAYDARGRQLSKKRIKYKAELESCFFLDGKRHCVFYVRTTANGKTSYKCQLKQA